MTSKALRVCFPPTIGHLLCSVVPRSRASFPCHVASESVCCRAVCGADDDAIDEAGPSGAAAAVATDKAGGEFDELEDDEMADFIEHDGPGGEAAARANQRALAKTARAQGISTEAAQDLLEVFGNEADTREMLQNWYACNEAAPAEDEVCLARA